MVNRKNKIKNILFFALIVTMIFISSFSDVKSANKSSTTRHYIN